MTTLHAAHNQWANRPADQTFSSLPDLLTAVHGHRVSARTATVPVNSLRVEADDTGLFLRGMTGNHATLTNWSFGQLAARAGAPAGYLRELPAQLAAENLNHGLARFVGDEVERDAKLLFNQDNGNLTMRAVTSDRYSRIWNNDVAGRLVKLVEDQPFWHLPKAYDRHNGLVGTPDENGMVARGAYASDRDMFVFMVDEGREITVPGSNPIKRGFFCWNSEVGSAAFGITTFLYDYVCGNHFVWGAKNVSTIRIRHTGEANSKAFGELNSQVKAYAESSGQIIEGQIVRAQNLLLGNNMDEVITTVMSKRISPLVTKGRLEKAFGIAENTERYGNPRSVWGMVNGLTELSQESPHTDVRAAHDAAAGKLLEIAF